MVIKNLRDLKPTSGMLTREAVNHLVHGIASGRIRNKVQLDAKVNQFGEHGAKCIRQDPMYRASAWLVS